MQKPSTPPLNTLQLLLAILAILTLHSLVGWQWSLIIPLLYAYFLPSRAMLECTLQMALAWLVLAATSYWLAPEETARMLEVVVNIVARNSAQGLGWLMPLVSVLFAALLGFLAGVVGSSVRFMLRNVHKYETGVV